MGTRSMTHASLFSGIGGAEVAAAWAGWRNVFHCDINGFGCRVLRYWFPESEEYHDITSTDFTRWRGHVDVLTAGFPCQPFSLAGKRRGGEDERYLWPEAFRALREIRPAWFVGENVSGIVSMVLPGERSDVAEGGCLFGEGHIDREVQRYVLDSICSDIESAGYEVQPLVIPACAVGAPHRRDRVWFVARRRACGPAENTERDGCEGASAETECEAGGQRMPGAGAEGRLCKAPADAQGDGDSGRPGAVRREERQQDGELNAKPRFHGKIPEGAAPHTDENRDPAQETRRGAEGGRGRDIPQQEERGDEAERACGLHGLPRDVPGFGGWDGFPSECPFLCGDDGIPERLAGLAIPVEEWNRRALEALGNAWVPEVAYEIFRFINIVENGTEEENRHSGWIRPH